MTRWLRDQGHDVAISAYTGILHRTTAWEGIPVFPPGLAGESVQHDLLAEHAERWEAELVIVLYDLWHFTLPPDRLPKRCPTAFWVPTDCTPADWRTGPWLDKSGAIPVAMSEFGRDQLTAMGFAAQYVPHAVDTSVYVPPGAARAEVREAFEIAEDAFAVGINATTTDALRKGLGEQLFAFAKFRRKHPSAVLLMHTLPAMPGGANAAAMASSLDIPVKWAPPYEYLTGGIEAGSMAAWYGALDVLSNCTYGEGFGLAAIEAQACGTPVILTRGTTGQQLVGPGWLAEAQPFWNWEHMAWWHAPRIDSIARNYEKAHRYAASKRSEAWQFAGQYAIQQVGPMWDKVLAEVS
jgi:glycosyltransferase involved in cell wall biosynthesis